MPLEEGLPVHQNRRFRMWGLSTAALLSLILVAVIVLYNSRQEGLLLRVLPNSSIRTEGKTGVPLKILVVEWPLFIGWNNLRATVEAAVWFGHLMDRKVVLPPYLRIQVCTNDTYCNLLREEVPDDKRPHCPIDLFLSSEALKEATVSYAAVKDRLDQEIGITMVEDFEKRFIQPSVFGSATREVWVDELPPGIAPSSAILPNYTLWVGVQADRDFTGGEFAWMMKPRPINLYGNLTVRGLANEFRKFQFPTLHLKGYPLCFGCTPGGFYSEESWNRFQNLRRKVVKYHPVIFELAEMMLSRVFGPLDEVSRQRDFIAIHLRRGDFLTRFEASVGIDKCVLKLRTCPENRKIYVATNEDNATVLEPLRSIGAVFWSDIELHITTVLRTQVKQLAFQDFVGLVEQVVCANARLFIGTRSSSVTGQILNLRGDLYGDWAPYQFLHQLEEDSEWNCSRFR